MSTGTLPLQIEITKQANMKYTGLLGALITTVMACGAKQGTPSDGTGGNTGVTTGGSTTNPGSGGSTGGNSTGGLPSVAGGSASTSATGGSSSGLGGYTGVAMGGMGQGGLAGGGSGTGGASTSAGNASVLERNGSPTRVGTWTQPLLTKAAAGKMAFDADFNATFTGEMFASPLFVEHGPGGKGVFVAVSADNQVALLDETTGAVVWSKSLGSSPGAAGQACGASMDPVGILSTPVIDEKAGTIYVAAAIGTATVERHEIHALSLVDGTSRSGWPVNVSALKAGDLSFNTQYQNQRSALALVNGIVYVAYGGFSGDCPDYHGWIVAVDGSDPTKVGTWATAGMGEAIWAAGGFASDGTDIFPVTGNNIESATGRDKSNSEAVVRLSGLAQFQKSDQNEYYPASWASMDRVDTDLGGSNSMLMTIPGSTPAKVLVTIAKDGKFYLLDPDNLGGKDGHVAVLEAASPTFPAGNGVRTAPTAYTTTKGAYVALTVQSGAECPNAIIGSAVMGVKITPGSPPTADVAWCAPGPNPPTAPISTTTDGKSEPIVWYVDNGQLRGVDGDTGETIVQDSVDTCTGVQRWTSPIAVKGRIIVGGSGMLCSWSPAQ